MTSITEKFDGAHENRAAKEFVLKYGIHPATPF
jgi:hypothetical protein